jgi:chemotaxis regulatin CheY-phosphate phosphatase CheZ
MPILLNIARQPGQTGTKPSIIIYIHQVKITVCLWGIKTPECSLIWFKDINMNGNRQNTVNEFKTLFANLDSNQQSEISVQLFLEYCIYQDQCENTRRLAPLINTVAEALTKNLENEDSLTFGVKVVQMYLRTPPAEYFGETLIRLGFLDRQGVDEMLQIQPKEKIFGTFLMDQGLITQEQRDIAVMAQKRLFTIHEIYDRMLHQHSKEENEDIIESLKGVFQHFMVSTAELENDLKKSKSENMHDTLQRLENIIVETEKHSQSVLEIVDQIFTVKDDLEGSSVAIRTHAGSANKVVADSLDKMNKNLDRLYTLNMELNSSQQIQDRIGQQMLKIIPSIQTFHDQLLKIANKLRLDWKSVESEEADLTKIGYGGTKPEGRAEQGDVDDLLSSLGL